MMSEIMNVYYLLKEVIEYKRDRSTDDFNKYIQSVFDKTECILKNYLDMFSEIRIGVISKEFDIKDIIEYLKIKENDLKTLRIYVRRFLKDKYYKDNEVMVKFVAAIYGIMECYPVTNSVIVDKSHHTINSYINYCKSLQYEDEKMQKIKIINMTDCILKDLTTSWETVCDCYRELINTK